MTKQHFSNSKEVPNPESNSAENVSDVFNAAFSVELATTPAAINEVLEVRYQVYCIDRPFEDPSVFTDKREHDVYDRRSVHALIRHKASGDGVAAVRLVLQGDEPEADFPMEGPCLDQMNRAVRKQVWETPRDRMAEISRLAVSREFRKRLNEKDSTSGLSDFATYSDTDGGRRAMPYISLGLFAAIVQMSVKHGITHWLAAMEPTLLRLLKRYGISFDHVGPTVDYHGRRRPVFTSAAALLEGIRQQRPDVWALITDAGRFVPGQMNPRQLMPSRKLVPIHGPSQAMVA